MKSSNPPAIKPALRQLIVMGGGGFSMEPRNPRLDRYVFSLVKKVTPRVCFVPTASGDSENYLDRFHRAMEKHPVHASALTLFRLNGTDPAKMLLEQDIIYVGGGSTANLLAIWRLHGIDRIMRQTWRRGIILCGLSAGMICWFQSSVTDSFGPVRELKDGLGFLPGSACPHYDSQPTRRPMYHRLIREKILPPGIAADDGAAIHFIDRKIFRCVSSRPNARVYRVGLRNGEVFESPMETQYVQE